MQSDPQRDQRVMEIVEAALLRSATEREAYLKLTCQGDAGLLREVSEALEWEVKMGGFLREPVIALPPSQLGLSPECGAAGMGNSAEHGRALPSTIGRYRILSLIGEGGMGVVYEAEQDNPRRTVALKVIRPGLARPELLRRFEQESQVLGRLHHPGIAQVYEAGTAETAGEAQPFLAMELIQGRPLTQYAADGRLDVQQRLRLMIQVCDAVQHAHQRGIIHRDIKPGNILVDEHGQPKILDFGVALAIDNDVQITRQTDIGQLVGTLAYMSPEQVLADPLALDTRSDVYALGVILYEVLAGKLPYQLSRRLDEAVRSIQQVDPAPLSSVSRVYRGDLETIVAKALEKDKARRYGSAADLASDLRRYLENEPILAKPPSAAYHLNKFARRNKALVIGIGAVVVVLFAGVVASAMEAERARAAERSAVAARQNAIRDRDRAVAAERMAVQDRNRATAAESQAQQDRNRAILSESQAVRDRNRALAEKERADNEAATAKAIDDFLQKDLLAQAQVSAQTGPNTSPDPDLKVRTALDRAAARIAGRFDKQPLVEASIRQTLGTTYWNLGLLPTAEAHLERALEIRRRMLGEEHPDTLSLSNDLGMLYSKESKYAQAEPLLVKTLEIRRRTLGKENPETAVSVNNLGALYRVQEKYAQTEPLYQESLDIRRRLFGEDHPNTATGMNNLAFLYYTQGKFPQAEPLYRKALEIRRRALGEEHVSTATAALNLGVMYCVEQRYSDAEPLLRRALDIRQRGLKEEHADTLAAMTSLALCSMSQRKFADAEPLMKKIVEIRRRVNGPKSALTATAIANLADLLAARQMYAEAGTLLGEACNDQEAANWKVYYCQSLTGAVLAGRRSFPEAESKLIAGYEGMLRLKPKMPGENRFHVGQAGERLVHLYDDWGKPESAARWKQLLQASPVP